MKCEDCGAVMNVTLAPDGTKTHSCPYCNKTIVEQPSGNFTDRLFSFANRLLNSQMESNPDKQKYLDMLNDPNVSQDIKQFAKRQLERMTSERSGYRGGRR